MYSVLMILIVILVLYLLYSGISRKKKKLIRQADQAFDD